MSHETREVACERSNARLQRALSTVKARERARKGALWLQHVLLCLVLSVQCTLDFKALQGFGAERGL